MDTAVTDGIGTDGTGRTDGTDGEAAPLPGQRTPEGASARPAPLRLELLVHGVGGTTPEVMLESPHLKQMTGDSMSGTYRRWPDQDAEQHPADYAGDAVLEAYSWAKLTSGAASRALWLLLLPFMFANLVHWMRPPGPPGAAAHPRLNGVYSALARLLAVSLTVLLTAGACEIAMDLAAWQCAADGACVAHHSWVVFALGGHGGWWGQPGRRLVVAALVPLAMLAALGQLSRVTWSSYERVRPMSAPRTGDEPIEMETSGFWYGVATVGRLRPLHLAAGLLTVAWTVLVPVIARDRQAAPHQAWIGIALLVLLVAVGALLLAGLGTGADALPPRVLLTVAAGLAVLVFGYAAWTRPAWTATGPLPGAEQGFAALLAGQLVLTLALAVTALSLTRGHRTTTPADPVATSNATTLPDPAATTDPAPAVPTNAAVPANLSAAANGTETTKATVPIDPTVQLNSGAPSTPAAPVDPAVPGAMAALASSPPADATVPIDPTVQLNSGAPSTPAAPVDLAAVVDRAGVGEFVGHIDPAAPVDPRLVVPRPELGAAEPADVGFGGPGGSALRGLAGPATGLLALGLGALFTSGAALLAAQRLAGKGDRPQAVPLLVWHASGTTLLAPVLLAVVLRLVVSLLRAKKALRSAVLAAYDEPPTTDSPRTGQITTALAGARLTEAGTGVIGTLALAAAVQLLVALAGALFSGESLTAATADLGMIGSRLGEMLQSLGGWLTTAFLVGLVALGRSAYTSPTRRRTVGVLWDIGTFWPRAAHPLAPPCYAERAVPDIEARMRTWLAADPARRLVLSAHSQGTVLAAAAMWQLDPATRGRVALLTYGSPLRRLYGRFFPAYMGPDQLMRLQRDMPRWDNLFRLTDPIGGPVRIPACAGSPAPDQPAFPDPLAFGRSEEYPILVPVNGHFDYRLDPRFLLARDALLGAIEEAPTTVG